MEIVLNQYEDIVNKAISKIETENIIQRVWKKDYTVWRDDPTEISNRLGWLDCVDVTSKSFVEINSFVDEVKAPSPVCILFQQPYHKRNIHSEI